MNDCKYCSENDDCNPLTSTNIINIFGIDIPFVMGIDRDKIEVVAGDETILQKKINFCPMCGRQLNLDYNPQR